MANILDSLKDRAAVRKVDRSREAMERLMGNVDPFKSSVAMGQPPRDTTMPQPVNQAAPEERKSLFGEIGKIGEGIKESDNDPINVLLPLLGVAESLITKKGPGASKEALKMYQEGKQADLARKQSYQVLEDSKGVAKDKARERELLSMIGGKKIQDGEDWRDMSEEELKSTYQEYLLRKDPTDYVKMLLGGGTKAAKTPEQVKLEMDFVKDYRSDLRVKSFNEVQSATARLNSVWNKEIESGDPQRVGIIDQALITTFNKITDPGSVVRESEYVRTGEGMPMWEKIPGFIERLQKGGPGITNEFRNELVRVANRMYAAAEAEHAKNVSDYYTQATTWGIRPDIALGRDFDYVPEVAEALKKGYTREQIIERLNKKKFYTTESGAE
jgi:hypothetical protein